MAKVTLTDNGQKLETHSGLLSGLPILLTTTEAQQHGTFNSVTRTTAGTTTATTPISGGSIWITDLLISGEKQAGSSVEVRFTDGSNTQTIFLASQVDAPASFATSFAGGWHGWVDARVDVITVGSGDATVAIGYMKLNGNHSITYAEFAAGQ
jgi:hypothetical protein